MLIAIFDKSFIHSISADEAAVFDMHFMSNITPLFFVEVLADLEKTNLEEGREALVKTLSRKTPVFRSYNNVPYHELVTGELHGYDIDLRRKPVISGGRRVKNEEGLATVYDAPPEMKAKTRWDKEVFGPEEYTLARAWRETLKGAPQQTAQLLGGSASRFTFSDLAAVRRFVEKLLNRDGSRFATLKSIIFNLDLHPDHQRDIIRRWKSAGGPRLLDFLPYTAHVVAIDMFKALAMTAGLIDISKTSNHADLAYLYYLPFCEIFISTDKLHRRCASLFMTDKQEFVWGNDLRQELAKLVATYHAHPEIEELGLIGVSGKTIFPAGSFIGDLIRRLHPRYNDDEGRDISDRLTPEQEKALMERITAVPDAPPAGPEDDLGIEDTSTTFTRMIPPRRGRFKLMPRADSA